MNNEKIQISFEFDLSFNEDIETEKQKKVDIDAIKDYIINHLKEIEGHRNFGTKIDSISILKK